MSNYRLINGESGLVVVNKSDGSAISSSTAFEVAQYEEIESESFFSAKPAELGLRIRSSLPNSEIILIARPSRGDWRPVGISDEYVTDGSKAAVILRASSDRLQNLLRDKDLSLGPNNFAKVASSAILISNEIFCEFIDDGEKDFGGRIVGNINHAFPLSEVLHDYQKHSVERFISLINSGIGGLLADDMGLGKTLQSIAIISSVVNDNGKVLVVLPSILIPNWLREFKKFAPSIKVGVNHRDYERFSFLSELRDFDVIITAYSTVGGKAGDVELLSGITWDLVVADEAQFIKNPDARRTLTTKSIPRRASLALTGTPLENSPLDLWSIGDFIFPGMLGESEEFDTNLEISPKAMNIVTNLLKPIMIRRSLADVDGELALPERFDLEDALKMPIWMEQAQKEILRDGKHQLQNFNRLIQLASHSSEIDPDLLFEANPKFQRLSMLIQAAKEKGEKVLVFSRYRESISKIVKFLESRSPETTVYTLHGSSGGPEDRQGIVDSFTGDKDSVLVANPDAAGFGLNIVAANHVVHFHPLWNPAKSDQATKRAHRPGQERVTYNHHFFYESSVEEYVMDRQKAKRELAKSVLSQEDLRLQQLDMVEILKALQGSGD